MATEFDVAGEIGEIINPLGHVEKLEDRFLADDRWVDFARLSYDELATLQNRYPILKRMLDGETIKPEEYEKGMSEQLRITVIALAVAKRAGVLSHKPSLAAIGKSIADMADVERDAAYGLVLMHSFPSIRKAFQAALRGESAPEDQPANRKEKRATAARARSKPSGTSSPTSS